MKFNYVHDKVKLASTGKVCKLLSVDHVKRTVRVLYSNGQGHWEEMSDIEKHIRYIYKKDVDGKPIYEGDIVKIPGYEEQAFVVWDEVELGWKLSTANSMFVCSASFNTGNIKKFGLKVIGSIYDE